MAKVFKIDDFIITLEESLFKEACRVYVLEDENNLTYSDTKEECEKGNYIHLKSNILAGFTESLDDIGKITFEQIRKNYADNIVSERVKDILLKEIKRNGGIYP